MAPPDEIHRSLFRSGSEAQRQDRIEEGSARQGRPQELGRLVPKAESRSPPKMYAKRRYAPHDRLKRVLARNRPPPRSPGSRARSTRCCPRSAALLSSVEVRRPYGDSDLDRGTFRERSRRRLPREGDGSRSRRRLTRRLDLALRDLPSPTFDDEHRRVIVRGRDRARLELGVL